MDEMIDYLQYVIGIACEECCLPQPTFTSCVVVSNQVYTVLAATFGSFELAIGLPEKVDGIEAESWDGGVAVTFNQETVRIPIFNLIDILQALKDKGNTHQ